MHHQESLMRAFKEQDMEDDFQVVIQNYGINQFDISLFFLIENSLLLLPEIGKFHGLDHQMQLLEARH